MFLIVLSSIGIIVDKHILLFHLWLLVQRKLLIDKYNVVKILL